MTTTDPVVTVVFFAAVLALVAAIGGVWQKLAEWREFDEQRRAERIRQRDRAEFVDLVRTYSSLHKTPDTFPASWAETA